MSSADITLPTVFQTAKVLQTIHMGESQARHKSEDVILFPFFFSRIDCGGRNEHETSTDTGTPDPYNKKTETFFHPITILHKQLAYIAHLGLACC